MTTGRVVFLAMVPAHLLLLVWVWIGRLAFGVGGWFLLIYLLSVVPAVLVALSVTTVLACTQPGRPRSLTGPQTLAQLLTWAALFALGLFTVDFGDTDDSERSVLTQLLGRSDAVLEVSYALMLGSAAAAVLAWGVLLGTLTLGRRRAGAEPPGALTASR